MLESLQQADQQLLIFLNGINSPFWDSFMWLFTAKITWVPMYAALLYVILKNFRISVSILVVIAIALTITYADQICATIIRPCVERLRPSNPQNPISGLIHLVNGKRGGRYGFPSCHAANSFALAFFVMLLFRQRMLTIAILLWATINSYSRVYIGVHYPGDLLVGAIVGLSGALIIYGLLRYALSCPAIVNRLKYKDPDRALIRHQIPAKSTRIIIYTGLCTVLVLLLYSLYSIIS